MQQQSNDSLLRAQDDSLPLQVLFSRSEDPPSNRIFALRVSISTAPPHWEASSSSTSRWRCPTVTSRCWRRCWRAPTPRWTRLLRRGRVELGAWDGSLIAWLTAIFGTHWLNTPMCQEKEQCTFCAMHAWAAHGNWPPGCCMWSALLNLL